MFGNSKAKISKEVIAELTNNLINDLNIKRLPDKKIYFYTHNNYYESNYSFFINEIFLKLQDYLRRGDIPENISIDRGLAEVLYSNVNKAVKKTTNNINENIIPFNNCLYDISSKTTIPFSPEYINIYKIGANYSDKKNSEVSFVEKLFKTKEEYNQFCLFLADVLVTNKKTNKIFVLKNHDYLTNSFIFEVIKGIVGEKNIDYYSLGTDKEYENSDFNYKLINVYNAPKAEYFSNSFVQQNFKIKPATLYILNYQSSLALEGIKEKQRTNFVLFNINSSMNFDIKNITYLEENKETILNDVVADMVNSIEFLSETSFNNSDNTLFCPNSEFESEQDTQTVFNFNSVTEETIKENLIRDMEDNMNKTFEQSNEEYVQGVDNSEHTKVNLSHYDVYDNEPEQSAQNFPQMEMPAQQVGFNPMMPYGGYPMGMPMYPQMPYTPYPYPTGMPMGGYMQGQQGMIQQPMMGGYPYFGQGFMPQEPKVQAEADFTTVETKSEEMPVATENKPKKKKKRISRVAMPLDLPPMSVNDFQNFNFENIDNLGEEVPVMEEYVSETGYEAINEENIYNEFTVPSFEPYVVPEPLFEDTEHLEVETETIVPMAEVSEVETVEPIFEEINFETPIVEEAVNESFEEMPLETLPEAVETIETTEEKETEEIVDTTIEVEESENLYIEEKEYTEENFEVCTCEEVVAETEENKDEYCCDCEDTIAEECLCDCHSEEEMVATEVEMVEDLSGFEPVEVTEELPFTADFAEEVVETTEILDEVTEENPYYTEQLPTEDLFVEPAENVEFVPVVPIDIESEMELPTEAKEFDYNSIPLPTEEIQIEIQPPVPPVMPEFEQVETPVDPTANMSKKELKAYAKEQERLAKERAKQEKEARKAEKKANKKGLFGWMFASDKKEEAADTLLKELQEENTEEFSAPVVEVDAQMEEFKKFQQQFGSATLTTEPEAVEEESPIIEECVLTVPVFEEEVANFEELVETSEIEEIEEVKDIEETNLIIENEIQNEIEEIEEIEAELNFDNLEKDDFAEPTASDLEETILFELQETFNQLEVADKTEEIKPVEDIEELPEIEMIEEVEVPDEELEVDYITIDNSDLDLNKEYIKPVKSARKNNVQSRPARKEVGTNPAPQTQHNRPEIKKEETKSIHQIISESVKQDFDMVDGLAVANRLFSNTADLDVEPMYLEPETTFEDITPTEVVDNAVYGIDEREFNNKYKKQLPDAVRIDFETLYYGDPENIPLLKSERDWLESLERKKKEEEDKAKLEEERIRREKEAERRRLEDAEIDKEFHDIFAKETFWERRRREKANKQKLNEVVENINMNIPTDQKVGLMDELEQFEEFSKILNS